MIEALIELLSDRANVVRATACSALERAGRKAHTAVPALLKNLTHDGAHVRSNSAEALGHVTHDDPTVIAALTKLIADSELTVAVTAVSSLALQTKLGGEVVRPLFAFINRLRADEGNDYRISNAYNAFGRLDAPPPAVIDELRGALTGGPPNNYDLGWAATQAIVGLGTTAAAAVPELIAAVRANRLGDNAALALVGAGAAGVNALAAMFDDPDENVRHRAVNLMWRIGTAGLPLLPAILRCIERTTDDWRRSHTINCVQYIGPTATAAIPDLIRHVRGQSSTAQAALAALRTFGAALVPHLPALLELNRTLAGKYVCHFAELFVALATYTPDVLEPLREQLRGAIPADGDDWNARWSKKGLREQTLRGLATLRACGHVADVGPVVAEVAPLVADPEVEVRRGAVNLLDALGSPAALPPIHQALTDTDEQVRLRAAEALMRQGDTSDETLAALVHAVGDRAPRVRRAAVDALNKLKASTDAVRAALGEATRDDDTKVADRARIALKKASAEPKAKAPRAKGKKKAE